MRLRLLVVLVVLGAVMLWATAAFAQYGAYGTYGEEQQQGHLRAKVGWFEPRESSLDGGMVFGVDYVVPHQREHLLYLTVDRLKADNANKETTAWSVLAGALVVTPQKWYYGGGVGVSRHKLKEPLTSQTDTNFAWELAGGLDIGRNAFGEVKYRDGGEDGNTGFILVVGMSF